MFFVPFTLTYESICLIFSDLTRGRSRICQGEHGEHGDRAYNESLGSEPLLGVSRTKPP